MARHRQLDVAYPISFGNNTVSSMRVQSGQPGALDTCPLLFGAETQLHSISSYFTLRETNDPTEYAVVPWRLYVDKYIPGVSIPSGGYTEIGANSEVVFRTVPIIPEIYPRWGGTIRQPINVTLPGGSLVTLAVAPEVGSYSDYNYACTGTLDVSHRFRDPRHRPTEAANGRVFVLTATEAAKFQSTFRLNLRTGMAVEAGDVTLTDDNVYTPWNVPFDILLTRARFAVKGMTGNRTWRASVRLGTYAASAQVALLGNVTSVIHRWRVSELLPLNVLVPANTNFFVVMTANGVEENVEVTMWLECMRLDDSF